VAPPRRAGFIAVPDGPEGLTVAKVAGRTTVFTHAGSDLVAIDARSQEMQRWPTGCDGTHGFPRVDERNGLVLASCADDGRVALLDTRTGDRLDDYDVGGGEALPAWSRRTGHFYVRSDPGTRLATIDPSQDGLTPIRDVEVPSVGHCLGTDNQGHYWTCDATRGQLLRFDDPAG
jgi:streptogramin lyase